MYRATACYDVSHCLLAKAKVGARSGISTHLTGPRYGSATAQDHGSKPHDIESDSTQSFGILTDAGVQNEAVSH